MKKNKFIITAILFINCNLLFAQNIINDNAVLKTIVDNYIEVLETIESSSKVIVVNYNSSGEAEYFKLKGIICRREFNYNPSYIFEYEGYFIVVYFGFEKYLVVNDSKNNNLELLNKVLGSLIPDTVINDKGPYSNVANNLIVDDFYSYNYTVIDDLLIKIERIITINK